MAEEIKKTDQTTIEKPKRVTNETILEEIVTLKNDVDFMRKTIDEIKDMVGFNDAAVTVPSRVNMNNDPGPFSDEKLS